MLLLRLYISGPALNHQRTQDAASSLLESTHPMSTSSSIPAALITAATLLALVASGCTSAQVKDDPQPVGDATTTGDGATGDGAAGDASDNPDAASDNPDATSDSADATSDKAPPSREAPPRPAGASIGATDLGEGAEAIEEALAEYRSGDAQSAISALKGLSGNPKVGFLAHYNLGVIADQQGRTAEAAAAFQECLRLNPDFSPALVNLVRGAIRQGKADQALNLADTWIRQRPDNLRHRDARFQALIALKRYEEVVREARETLRKDERNVRAMQSMAAAYQALGKFELAQDILLQVVQVNEDPAVEAEVYHRLGLVYLAQDKEPKALGAFEQAVKLRPDFAEARNDLGVLYHKARDYSNAAEHFKNAIAVYPSFTEAMLNLGNAYKGLGNFTEAEATFKRAIQTSSRAPDPYFNLGVLYLDATIEGRDKKQQLQLAIDNFNRYKVEMKSALTREDPADQYINEAKKKIELEIKREQQRREQLKAAEAPPEEDGTVDLGEEGADEDK